MEPLGVVDPKAASRSSVAASSTPSATVFSPKPRGEADDGVDDLAAAWFVARSRTNSMSIFR